MTTRELTKALNAIVRNYSGTKKAPKRLFKAELEDRTLISDGHTVYGLINQDFEFVTAKLKNADVSVNEALIKIWADAFKNADADAEIYGGYDIDKKLSVYVIRNEKTDVVVNKKFMDVISNAEIKISGAKSPLTACNDEIKAIVLPINNKLSREELTAKCDEVKSLKEAPVFQVENLTDPMYILNNCYVCVQKPGEENIVKRNFLDLEMYIRVKVSNDGSYKLASQFADIDGLWDMALENTKKNVKVTSMLDTMREMMGNEAVDELLASQELEETMFVISNVDRVHGASSIAFNSELKAICERTGATELTIIPSSIHECLAIVGHQNEDMINEVNATQVSLEEQLGNHGYYYSLETDEITY